VGLGTKGFRAAFRFVKQCYFMPGAWENPVKRRLRDGLPVVAGTITVANLDVAAHMANLGFDFLWVEMEHSPITLETLRNMVLATRDLPALTFARVPVNELWTAKRVLDAGVSGVIFPFTSTPELAAQAVAACRYPPAGRRGSGGGLARSSWPDRDGPYPDSADRHVMVIIIIEEARAVERVEEIAATPGVDVLFIGTSDLSFSLGLRGQQDDPKLEEAIARVVEAGKRHQKFLGRPAPTPELAKQYMKQGFRVFQAPAELGLLTAGAQRYLEPLDRSGSRLASRGLY
jgi:2-keto-3-deoxy-L-rhamnonate aldolase RhmA